MPELTPVKASLSSGTSWLKSLPSEAYTVFCWLELKKSTFTCIVCTLPKQGWEYNQNYKIIWRKINIIIWHKQKAGRCLDIKMSVITKQNTTDNYQTWNIMIKTRPAYLIYHAPICVYLCKIQYNPDMEHYPIPFWRIWLDHMNYIITLRRYIEMVEWKLIFILKFVNRCANVDGVPRSYVHVY